MPLSHTLAALGDEHLSVPTGQGSNAGLKPASLVAGMATSACPTVCPADPEPQSHLHERQAAGVQLNSFCEVALIEPPPARRDRAADEVRRRGAAMNAEPLTEFHQRRARLVQGHKFI